MPPRRAGHRGGPRGGAHIGRGRGRGLGGSSAAARGRAGTSYAGVKKTAVAQKGGRAGQPRVAAALASAVPAMSTEPTTTAEEQEVDTQPPQPSKWQTVATVTRISRPGQFTCTPDSLFFTNLGHLDSSVDTETIALNLMDHFLLQQDFLAELWHGVLHAVCFLLASELTGRDNSVIAVAKAVEAQAAGLAEQGVGDLGVSVEAVAKGYAAVLEQRGRLVGLVGGYAGVLEGLVGAPDGGKGLVDGYEVEEEIGQNAEVGVMGEFDEAELFDCYDFDVYQEPE